MTVPSTAPNTSPRDLSYARDLWQRREFAMFLALGHLKARNASTTLGLLWWVLNPLLLAGVYFLVFGFILPTSDDKAGFLAYLLSGIFPFTFTSMAMAGGANAILANRQLLANLKFPRLILPFSAIVEAGFGFLTSMVAFYALVVPSLLIFGGSDSVDLGLGVLLFVPVFVIHTVFNVGLAALMARLAVPFRDVNNLIPTAVRLWLYLSPIIWPLSVLDRAPGWVSVLVSLNPLVPFLELYRTILTGAPFALSSLLLAIVWAGVFAVGGVWVFVRQEGHMVRYL